MNSSWLQTEPAVLTTCLGLKIVGYLGPEDYTKFCALLHLLCQVPLQQSLHLFHQLHWWSVLAAVHLQQNKLVPCHLNYSSTEYFVLILNSKSLCWIFLSTICIKLLETESGSKCQLLCNLFLCKWNCHYQRSMLCLWLWKVSAHCTTRAGIILLKQTSLKVTVMQLQSQCRVIAW